MPATEFSVSWRRARTVVIVAVDGENGRGNNISDGPLCARLRRAPAGGRRRNRLGTREPTLPAQYTHTHTHFCILFTHIQGVYTRVVHARGARSRGVPVGRP